MDIKQNLSLGLPQSRSHPNMTYRFQIVIKILKKFCKYSQISFQNSQIIFTDENQNLSLKDTFTRASISTDRMNTCYQYFL